MFDLSKTYLFFETNPLFLILFTFVTNLSHINLTASLFPTLICQHVFYQLFILN